MQNMNLVLWKILYTFWLGTLSLLVFSVLFESIAVIW